ncbi:MAG: ferrous iron transport protein A [Clostridia bacterium]
MENIMDLSGAPLGTDCTVKALEGMGPMKRRLIDLGLVEGTRVSPLFESLSGNPRAYCIRGAVIALRNEDAKLIKVAAR